MVLSYASSHEYLLIKILNWKCTLYCTKTTRNFININNDYMSWDPVFEKFTVHLIFNIIKFFKLNFGN